MAVVPYLKTKGEAQLVSVLVFTKGDDKVEIKELREWKFSQSVKVLKDELLANTEEPNCSYSSGRVEGQDRRWLPE